MLPFQGAGAGQAIEVSRVLVHPPRFPPTRSRRRTRATSIHSPTPPHHPSQLTRAEANHTSAHCTQDAHILATLLAHPLTTRRTLARAAEVYDAVRRPVAQRVAAVSREAGMLYTLSFPGLAFPEGRERAGDAERLQAVYERVRDNWKWAWETTVDADVARAVGMLEGRV